MVPTGGKHTIARKHFEKLKNGCIVGNMGHSTQEIDLVSECMLCHATIIPVTVGVTKRPQVGEN